MKKNITKVLFTILIMFLTISVKADNFTFYNPVDEKFACPQSSFTLNKVGTVTVSGNEIRYYNATVNNSTYGQTFCMAPGKMNGLDFNPNFTCQRILHPEKKANQALDVALTIAYQKMVNDKIITGTPTEKSRKIGTIAFRWIESAFNKLDDGISYSGANVRPWYYSNRKSSYWNNSDDIVKAAVRVAEYAVRYGNKIKNNETTYQKLVNNGIIWTDQWDFEYEGTNQIDANHVEVTFIMKTKNGKKAPDVIQWNEFDVNCEYGYSCSTNTSKIKKINNNSARFKVTIDTSKGKANKASSAKQKYGIKITTAFSDLQSPYAHIMYLTPNAGETYYQKMLLVKDYNPSFLIQTEIPVDWPGECVCETVNGRYTGNYVYTKKVNDETITEVFPFNDERAKTYKCEDSAKCNNNSCEIVDGKYYGDRELHPDGLPVDEATYRKECLHVCQTPEESGDGNYYCKEISPEKGGEKCSEKEYNDDCLCPPLKEKCEENPGGPECSEYEEKCPNCNASVSVPGTCNDFDTNSNAVGTISDINQTATECNNTVNQVKRCVIDGTDQANESYEDITEIKDNRYCKVWCEENYQFNVPTARYSLSGGYFNLSTQISATRNCYVSSAANPKKPIDNELFEADVNELNIQITEAYEKWLANKNDSTYKELTDLNEKMKQTIEEFNECSTGWYNNMSFDPTIEFTYHEKEYTNISNGKFSLSGNVASTSNNIYCLGDTDEQYQCLSNALVSNSDAVPNGLYKNLYYTVCDNTGCKNTETLVSQAKWIQKSKTREATYVPGQQFSTYHQYGTVVSGTPCKGTGFEDCLWTRLPDSAMPVELKTGKGAFPFVLKFSNIGQSNKDGSLGRLVGYEQSILNEYNKLPEKEKCAKNENSSGPDNLKILEQNVGYVCAYVNNCPECDVSCEDENNCIIEEVCDGECKVSCKNCIFDGINTRYKFRTVSLNNLFPNSCDDTNSTECRKEGYNWSTQKAQYTKQQIESDGDKVYEEPEYSYTLTESQKANIRDYNRKVGSYSNSNTIKDNGEQEIALKCDQITDQKTNLTYSVRCRSTFLENTDGKYFTQNVNRPDFVLWTESEYCLSNNCVLSREDGIGPSWK